MKDRDTVDVTVDAKGESRLTAASIVPDAFSEGTPKKAYPTGNYKGLGARVPKAESAPKPAPRPEVYDVQSALLTKVEIHPWPQRYNYYQRFSDDAERFFSVRGKEVPAEPYFSYIPQYAQLSHAQLLYYLWFRENARRGVYLEDVDLPYILLYIYEIINLPHKIAPEDGAHAMAGVWLAYRGRRGELDRYLAEWMCDYCLIGKVPLPEELYPIVPEILPKATLKEFYVSAVSGDGITPEALILLASDYSYKSSKYYKEQRDAFDRHIPAAVGRAAALCGIAPDPASMKKVKIERDAYCGSLCAQTVKRRIIVEYYSFTRSYEMRRAVTAAVKLAENFVRRGTKIRSRLSITMPDPEIGTAVASYFDKLYPTRPTKAEEDTTYEKLYDAPSEGVDFAAARSLEVKSWETTDILTADGADEPETPLSEIPAPVAEETAKAAEKAAIPYADALRAILDGEKLEAFCKAQKSRVSEAEIAGQINDFFADAFGDIVLELSGTGYTLIDDYKEEVEAWLTAD